MEFVCGTSLDGLDVALPSVEEQVKKRAQALKRLCDYLESCGGQLPDGWTCTMRFRVTSRRHGRPGLTTDNFYYSPCGRTFRSHKQVAEYLGLHPVSKLHCQQQQQQQETPEQYSVVSVTFLHTNDDPVCSTASGCGKRSYTVMARADTAGDSSEHTGLCSELPSAATMSPPVAACTLGAASSVDPAASSSAQALPPVKRTKAALAAKYTSLSSVAAAQGAAPSVGPSIMPSCCSSAVSQSSCCTGYDRTDTPQLPPAAGLQDSCAETVQVMPAQPAASSTGGAASTGDSRAVTSRRLPAVPPATHKLPPPQQPVPKWKPIQHSEWRAKQRELANQALASLGIVPQPCRSSGGA